MPVDEDRRDVVLDPLGIRRAHRPVRRWRREMPGIRRGRSTQPARADFAQAAADRQPKHTDAGLQRAPKDLSSQTRRKAHHLALSQRKSTVRSFWIRLLTANAQCKRTVPGNLVYF